MNVGTYNRQKTESDGSYAGQHYYYFLNNNFTAGQWIYVELNRQLQHQVGGPSGYNLPLDPENYVGTYTNNGSSLTFPSVSNNGANTPYHFFDILTRWYIGFGNGGTAVFSGATFEIADFELSTVINEPDDLVSSITVHHNGTAYEISHATPANVSQVYTYYWSLSSMQNPDGSWNGTGTLVGTATASNNDYLCYPWIATSSMLQQTLIYFFIQPTGSPNGTQVAMADGPTL